MAQHLKKITASIALLICLGSPTFAADDVMRLSNDNITSFIQKTTDITSGNASLGTEEVIAYLNMHLDPDARFKSTMKYIMPGQPAQENSLSLNKKEFIESVEQGQKAIADYETTVDIKKIKISSDGTKATVQTVSKEGAVLPLSVDGEVSEIPVQGISTCMQILMLNDGIIQMYNANCETTIEFLDIP